MTILKPEEHSILDFVQVYKKAMTKEQCSSIIKKINVSDGWSQHKWTNYNKIVEREESEVDSECSRIVLSGISRLLVSNCVKIAVDNYKKYVYKTLDTEFGFNGMTIPGINRYVPGQEMAHHVDHINSIFDGELKGIPTLSVVGLLNDDFEGGEFKFWDKYDMNLEMGDIMIFPSNFLYKHQVDRVTNGTRYSFVSWIY